ncbi:MAG: TadE/TadG family type IV pilus assembly protein [Gemmatimonadota bacterium]
MNGIRLWTRDGARRGLRGDRRDSGQALAEIAIALPILLLMMVGIFEFARAYQIQQVVVNAAREGARTVVLPGVDSDSAKKIVNNYLASGNVTPASVTVNNIDSPGTDPGQTGNAMSVQITVDYSFTLVGPMVRLATGKDGGPGDITLSSQATMRHE